MTDSAMMYTDGASKGNPGPAAIGVLIVDAEGLTLAEISERVGNKTNNEAEYLALIRGLEEARLLGIKRLKWVTDSQLLERQWTGQYRVKKPELQRLYLKAQDLARHFDSFSPSHTLRDGNEKADSLANRAFKPKSQ
jgi:ribonuclease HI